MIARATFRWRARGVALLLAFTLALTAQAQTAATEYEVKAAYLLNFGKFVKWPSSEPVTESFAICILGEDPFGKVLDATIRDEKVDGKPIVARRIAHGQDVSGCKVLFLGRSEEKQLSKLLPGLQKAGILTVSDIPGFLDHNGMIQFTFVGNRIRFEVNLDSVQESGLTLSSELLKVASFVKGKSRAGVR